MAESDPFDPEMLSIFQIFTQALIQDTPEHFRSAFCVIEQAPGHAAGRLQYRIGSVDYPDEGTTRPSTGLHEAAYQLFRHWTRNGQRFPATEFTIAQEPDGNWRNSVRILEPQGAGGEANSQVQEEERWQAVYRAREQFFSSQFGPLPGEIQKLMNLMGVWPGGGLFQFEATQRGGLGICTQLRPEQRRHAHAHPDRNYERTQAVDPRCLGCHCCRS